MLSNYYKKIGAALLGLVVAFVFVLGTTQQARADISATDQQKLLQVENLLFNQDGGATQAQAIIRTKVNRGIPSPGLGSDAKEALKNKLLERKDFLTVDQAQILNTEFDLNYKAIFERINDQHAFLQFTPRDKELFIIATKNDPGSQARKDALAQMSEGVRRSFTDELVGGTQATQDYNQANTPSPDNDHCKLFPWPDLYGCIRQGIAALGTLLAYLFGVFLYVCIEIFNLSIQLSIYDFPRIADLEVIRATWAVGRDFANMFFIFLLLYSAIGTILDLQKANLKKNFVNILLIAVFINFSYPIARVTIDVTNIIALEFYNKITPDELNNNPAWYIVRNITPSSGLSLEKMIKGLPQDDVPPDLTVTSAIVSTFGASIVTLAMAFTFLGASLLFVYRTVTLLFVIMLSSLAFFAMILPRAESYYGKWWNLLINNAVFAPFYLFFLYFVLRVMGDTKFNDILSGGANGEQVASGIAAALYYLFLFLFLNGGLMLANELSNGAYDTVKKYTNMANGYVLDKARTVSGANFAQRNITRGAQYVAGLPGDAGNYLGRNTIGAAARSLAGSDFMKNIASRNPVVGGAIRNAVKNLGDTGFSQDERTKIAQTRLGEFRGDPERQAAVLAGMAEGGGNISSAQDAYNSLSAEDKIRIYDKATPEQRKAIDKLRAGYTAPVQSSGGVTPAGPDAKKQKELDKAEAALAKDKLVDRLSGGGRYVSGVDKTSLVKMSSEELGKILGKVPNMEEVINDLQLNQFKNFLINESNLSDPNVVAKIKTMYLGPTSTLNAGFMRFVDGNYAARENLGLPVRSPGTP